MIQCEGCGISIAVVWKYCIYCGRPQTDAAGHPVETFTLAAAVTVDATAADSGSSATAADTVPMEFGAFPATLPESPLTSFPDDPLDDVPEEAPSSKRSDVPFWVGISMGVLGIALIIYAITQIYSVYA